MGLREDKKAATRLRLIETALDLFESRGFDNVSVAAVAAAADVSKMTVFNYFPVKEDLITGVGAHHIGEPAAAVRGRPAGQTAHRALLEFFLVGMERREPYTGLSDDAFSRRVARLITDTPALLLRALHYRYESQRLLAEVLVEESSSEFTARLVAAQILGSQQVVIDDNRSRVLAGESADDVYPDAVKRAEHAYRLLDAGLGKLFARLDSARAKGRR